MGHVVTFIVLLALGIILVKNGTGAHAQLGQLILTFVGLIVALVVGIWVYMAGIHARQRADARRAKQDYEQRIENARREKRERKEQEKALEVVNAQCWEREKKEREAALARTAPGRAALRGAFLQGALDEFRRSQ